MPRDPALRARHGRRDGGVCMSNWHRRTPFWSCPCEECKAQRLFAFSIVGIAGAIVLLTILGSNL